jgi:hypothetical protein
MFVRGHPELEAGAAAAAAPRPVEYFTSEVPKRPWAFRVD